jgi:hypothetical protein
VLASADGGSVDGRGDGHVPVGGSRGSGRHSASSPTWCRPGSYRRTRSSGPAAMLAQSPQVTGIGGLLTPDRPPAGRWCYSVSAGVAGWGAAGESPVVSLMPYRQ